MTNFYSASLYAVIEMKLDLRADYRSDQPNITLQLAQLTIDDEEYKYNAMTHDESSKINVHYILVMNKYASCF